MTRISNRLAHPADQGQVDGLWWIDKAVASGIINVLPESPLDMRSCVDDNPQLGDGPSRRRVGPQVG